MKVIPYADRLFRGNIYRSLDIAASGMTSQRMRMDAISSNIANISTTNADGAGNPYLRRHVVMRPDPGQTFTSVLRKETIKLKRTRPAHMLSSRSYKGTEQTPCVEGTQIEIPNMKKNVIYDPTHPDADADGFVVMPDINIIDEMADLMIAQRSFEANVTVIDAAKNMISKSLEI
jgi:flagellar basal-body rod protein FlgC